MKIFKLVFLVVLLFSFKGVRAQFSKGNLQPVKIEYLGIHAYDKFSKEGKGSKLFTVNLDKDSTCVEYELSAFVYDNSKRIIINDTIFIDRDAFYSNMKRTDDLEKRVVEENLKRNPKLTKDIFLKELKDKLSKINWDNQKVDKTSYPEKIYFKFSNGEQQPYLPFAKNYNSPEVQELIDFLMDFTDNRIYEMYMNNPIPRTAIIPFSFKECYH